MNAKNTVHRTVAIAACLCTDQPYVIRDVDGTELTKAKGWLIVTHHHQVDPAVRAKDASTRKSQRLKHRTSRVSQKSPSAPTSRPATDKPTSPRVA